MSMCGKRKSLLAITAALALSISAVGCGGGGGSDSGSSSSSNTLAGTAAKGAAIADGTVTVKDSKGKTATTKTDSKGKYSAELKDSSGGTMTGPFIVKVVDGSKEYYSVASKAGTTNVTPMTNVITANALGKSPKNVFDLPDPSTDSSFSSASTIETKVAKAEKNLESQLGIGSKGYDLMSGSLEAGTGTDVDGVLDKFHVSENATNGNFTIVYGKPGDSSAVKIVDEYDADDGDASKEKNYSVDLTNVSENSIDSMDETTLTQLAATQKEVPMAEVAVDTNLTMAEMNSKGLTALLDHDSVSAANSYFEASSAKAGTEGSNDADAAKLFHAMTRVAALGFDIESDDNTADGFKSVGDIMDAVGCNTDMRTSWEVVSCPDVDTTAGKTSLGSSAPTGEDLRVFLHDVLIPEIDAALVELKEITSTFTTKVTHKGKTYNVDYSDALVAKGYYEAMLSQLYIMSAFNVSVDIDDAIKKGKSAETLKSEYSDFLKLGSCGTNCLTNAKTHYLAALSDFSAAVTALDAESAGTDEELFTMDFSDSTPAKASVKAKSAIDSLKTAADGSVDISSVGPTFSLNLSSLFAGTLNLNGLLPKTSGDNDKVDRKSVDWTFGGVNKTQDLKAP